MNKTLLIMFILIIFLIIVLVCSLSEITNKTTDNKTNSRNYCLLSDGQVEAFLGLISMGYLKIFDEKTVFVCGDIWKPLNIIEKRNFCINLSLYIELTMKSGTSGFYIYDIQSGIKFGKYTREWGYQQFTDEEKEDIKIGEKS
jgi:hypothetical protein